MPSNRMMSRAIVVAAAVVAAGDIVQEASAHSLKVARGMATITGDTLEVRLEPQEHKDSTLAQLTICDDQGVRLLGRRASTSPASARAKDSILRYALAPNTRYISFQLKPPGKGGAGHTANVALTVCVNGERRNAIYLGSSGNVELVRILSATVTQTPARAAEDTGPCASHRKDWVALRNGDRSVRSIVAVEDWGVEIELLIPTPVIETWIPIRRANRDFIDANERRRAISMAEAFIADRFDVRVNGSNRLATEVKAHFLDPASPQDAMDGELHRLSAWTTGLLLSLQFRSAQRPEHVEVHWKLFNAIVLTANALMVTPVGCHQVDFSTYNPRWSWDRP